MKYFNYKSIPNHFDNNSSDKKDGENAGFKDVLKSRFSNIYAILTAS
jgi:hypothetical protein